MKVLMLLLLVSTTTPREQGLVSSSAVPPESLHARAWQTVQGGRFNFPETGLWMAADDGRQLLSADADSRTVSRTVL